MKVGIVCYPTYGGSGVVATELGLGLAKEGHDIHFITYSQPTRLDFFNENLYYHEVDIRTYPLFQYPPYELALASKMVDVVKYEKLDLLHVHYAIPHASAAYLAKQILQTENISIPIITTLHGTDITLVEVAADWADLSTPAYCWYGNAVDNEEYGLGALYNWFAASSEKLCPTGWHVATDEDWDLLEEFIRSEGYETNQLGDVLTGTEGWDYGIEGTNEYGFNGEPGGYRSSGNFLYYPSYSYEGENAYWWTSTEFSSSYCVSRKTYKYTSGSFLYSGSYDKKYGFSVRCVED